MVAFLCMLTLTAATLRALGSCQCQDECVPIPSEMRPGMQSYRVSLRGILPAREQARLRALGDLDLDLPDFDVPDADDIWPWLVGGDTEGTGGGPDDTPPVEPFPPKSGGYDVNTDDDAAKALCELDASRVWNAGTNSCDLRPGAKGGYDVNTDWDAQKALCELGNGEWDDEEKKCDLDSGADKEDTKEVEPKEPGEKKGGGYGSPPKKRKDEGMSTVTKTALAGVAGVAVGAGVGALAMPRKRGMAALVGGLVAGAASAGITYAVTRDSE